MPYAMAEEISDMFKALVPAAPRVLQRSRYGLKLQFELPEDWSASRSLFVFKLQTHTKMLGWVNAYCGGKTTTFIDNLQPGVPHKFRLKLYLDIKLMRHLLQENECKHDDKKCLNEDKNSKQNNLESVVNKNENAVTQDKENEIDGEFTKKLNKIQSIVNNSSLEELNNATNERYVQSDWSNVLTAATDSEGPSVICFYMAVRCGYLKQVQKMLNERPELVNIPNTVDGFTPLATAVRKGHIAMTRLLIKSGADVNEASSTGQTPLHLSILNANICLADILLDRNADIAISDKNGLRALHYAVDSRDVRMVLFILKRSAVDVKDNKGWTPLHRAVMQAAPTAIIQELLRHGADPEQLDKRLLSSVNYATLSNKREDIQRLVDKNFVRDKAFSNFAKLTKKLSTIQALMHK